MTNSRAGSGLIKLLDSHVASTTESSYTFTSGLDLGADGAYKEIIVFIQGQTSGALILELQVSGLETTYALDKMSNIAGTLAGTQSTSQTHFEILGSDLITGAGRRISAIIHITASETGGTDHVWFDSKGNSAGVGNQSNTGYVATSEQLSSIKILTSTSTWLANTEIKIYGLKA